MLKGSNQILKTSSGLLSYKDESINFEDIEIEHINDIRERMWGTMIFGRRRLQEKYSNFFEDVNNISTMKAKTDESIFRMSAPDPRIISQSLFRELLENYEEDIDLQNCGVVEFV